MIMVFYGLAEGRKTKTPQAFGDLRRLVWLKFYRSRKCTPTGQNQ
jgi:hypothetical protein